MSGKTWLEYWPIRDPGLMRALGKYTAFLEGYNKVSETPLVITDNDREKMLLYQMLMYLRSYAETDRYGLCFRNLQRIAIKPSVYSFLRKLRRMEKKRDRGMTGRRP